jgi:hypothetical protein
MTRAPHRPSGWQHEERQRYGARNLAQPEPGYFQMRLVRGGVFVGARILHEPTRDPETGEPLDRSWLWHGLIDNEPDPDASPAPTERVLRIWTYGRRIERAECEFLIADRAWARRNTPLAPEATPREPIDPLTAPPPF